MSKIKKITSVAVVYEDLIKNSDLVENVVQQDLNKELKTDSDSLLRLQIGLAFFAFVLLGANDAGLGVVLPSLCNYYGLDSATVGLLFVGASIGYLVAAFSSGVVSRKLGRYLFLLLGATSLLLGEVVFSLKPPFLFLLLVPPPLIGFGAAIIEADLNSYVAKLPSHAALLNYLHGCYGIGALLGPVVASGVLAAHLGWNSTYFVWVGMSLVLLIGFGLVFRWSDSSAQEDETEHSTNLLVETLKLRVVWMAALFLFFYIGIEASLGDWSYSFLTEERHENPLLSGGIVSGYWMGLTIGCLTLAKVSEQVGDKLLIKSCLAGVFVGVLLVWLMPLSVTEATGLWLAGFSLGPIFPTTLALMSNTIPNNLLLSGISVIASLSHIGSSLFPWLAGNLAEAFGQWSLLPYVISLIVGMLLLWLTWHTGATPSPSFEQPEGPVLLDSAFYVERPPVEGEGDRLGL